MTQYHHFAGRGPARRHAAPDRFQLGLGFPVFFVGVVDFVADVVQFAGCDHGKILFILFGGVHVVLQLGLAFLDPGVVFYRKVPGRIRRGRDAMKRAAFHGEVDKALGNEFRDHNVVVVLQEHHDFILGEHQGVHELGDAHGVFAIGVQVVDVNVVGDVVGGVGGVGGGHGVVGGVGDVGRIVAVGHGVVGVGRGTYRVITI